MRNEKFNRKSIVFESQVFIALSEERKKPKQMLTTHNIYENSMFRFLYYFINSCQEWITRAHIARVPSILLNHYIVLYILFLN